MKFLTELGKKTVVSTRFRSVFMASMVAMTISYVLVLIDNVVAGQMICGEAVAAMSLVFPLLPMLFFISYMIADGLGMMAAYAQGRDDRIAVSRFFSQGIILSLGLGIGLVVLLGTFQEKILAFWKISPELMAYALAYYSAIKWLPPVVFLNIFLYTFLVQEGEEQICAMASVVAMVVNVILDVVLCHELGVMGIGLATVIGTLISCFMQCRFLLSDKSRLKFSWWWDFRQIIRGLTYSFYHSIDTLYLSVLPVILSAYVIARWGESHIIVVTVITNVLVLVIALYTGVVDCLQPMVCQYHAEGNLLCIKKTMRLGIATTIAISLLVSVVGIIGASILPYIFGVAEEAIAVEATRSLRLFLIFTVFLGITLMYSNYYIYIKHWSQGLLVKTLLLLVLPTAGMLLGELYGIEGMWLGIGGAFVAAYGINLAVVKLRHHGRNLLLMDKERTNRQLSYDINSVMDEVMALSVKVAQDLQKLGVSAAKIIRLRLLVEEIGMHAVERAEGNVFQMEISFLLSSDPAEAIIMSVRDNAPPYDIIAVVQQGEFSWREHFIESITADLPKRRYLSAGDENRFMLEID